MTDGRRTNPGITFRTSLPRPAPPIRHAPDVAPEIGAAVDALAANRLDVAETRLRERLHVAPQDQAALRLLGEVASRVGRFA